MKAAILLLIRMYQLTLSSLLGRQCRFLPTCSDYARQAIEKHGILCGGRLALRRIGRCHPWGGEGFDPVPEHPDCARHK
jgi:putative membrane protein insertion efficiency factor